MSNNLQLPIDAALSALLAQKAAMAHKPLEDIILEMLRDAVERDEDLYFARLSERREQEAAGRTVTHDDAWR